MLKRNSPIKHWGWIAALPSQRQGEEEGYFIIICVSYSCFRCLSSNWQVRRWTIQNWAGPKAGSGTKCMSSGEWCKIIFRKRRLCSQITGPASIFAPALHVSGWFLGHENATQRFDLHSGTQRAASTLSLLTGQMTIMNVSAKPACQSSLMRSACVDAWKEHGGGRMCSFMFMDACGFHSTFIESLTVPEQILGLLFRVRIQTYTMVFNQLWWITEKQPTKETQINWVKRILTPEHEHEQTYTHLKCPVCALVQCHWYDGVYIWWDK